MSRGSWPTPVGVLVGMASRGAGGDVMGVGRDGNLVGRTSPSRRVKASESGETVPSTEGSGEAKPVPAGSGEADKGRAKRNLCPRGRAKRTRVGIKGTKKKLSTAKSTRENKAENKDRSENQRTSDCQRLKLEGKTENI